MNTMDLQQKQLSGIERLPSEINVEIMKNLDLDSLRNLAIASPALYSEYKAAEHVITYSITEALIGRRLFPTTIAWHAAATTDWRFSRACNMPREEVAQRIHEFGEKYLVGSELMPRTKFSFPMAKAIIEHHNHVDKWLDTIREQSFPQCASELTRIEIQRMMRALYIREIVIELYHPDPQAFMEDEVGLADMLWDYFKPWEYLQVQWLQRGIVEIIECGFATSVKNSLQLDAWLYKWPDFFTATFDLRSLSRILPPQDTSEYFNFWGEFKTILADCPAMLRRNIQRLPKKALTRSPTTIEHIVRENHETEYGAVSLWLWMYSAFHCEDNPLDSSEFVVEAWLGTPHYELDSDQMSWFMMSIFEDRKPAAYTVERGREYNVPEMEVILQSLPGLRTLPEILAKEEES